MAFSQQNSLPLGLRNEEDWVATGGDALEKGHRKRTIKLNDQEDVPDVKGLPDALTSMKVFRSFITRSADGTLNASEVTSLECYHAWLESRKGETKHPEKAFQRALTGHITGLDGRSPFTAEEEHAVLKALRRKQRWPCFEHTPTKFGELGFRALGFHERIRIGEIEMKSSTNKRAKMYKQQLQSEQEQRDHPGQEVKAASNSSSSLTDPESMGAPLPFPESPLPESSSSSFGWPTTLFDMARPFVPSFFIGDEHDEPLAERTHPASFRQSTKSQSRTGPKSSKSPRTCVEETEEDGVPTFDHPDDRATTTTTLKSPPQGADALQLPPDDEPGVLNVINGRSPRLNYESLIVSLHSLAEKLRDFRHLMSIIWTFARMRILGRVGWANPPTMEEAERLLGEIQARHPNDYIILFDFTCASFADRILLQNERAIELFGRISRHDGGFRGRRFLRSDAFTVFKWIALAFSFPGREFPLRIRGLLHPSNVEKPGEGLVTEAETALFDVCICVHEESRLLVERGTYVGPAAPVALSDL